MHKNTWLVIPPLPKQAWAKLPWIHPSQLELQLQVTSEKKTSGHRSSLTMKFFEMKSKAKRTTDSCRHVFREFRRRIFKQTQNFINLNQELVKTIFLKETNDIKQVLDLKSILSIWKKVSRWRKEKNNGSETCCIEATVLAPEILGLVNPRLEVLVQAAQAVELPAAKVASSAPPFHAALLAWYMLLCLLHL